MMRVFRRLGTRLRIVWYFWRKKRLTLRDAIGEANMMMSLKGILDRSRIDPWDPSGQGRLNGGGHNEDEGRGAA